MMMASVNVCGRIFQNKCLYESVVPLMCLKAQAVESGDSNLFLKYVMKLITDLKSH